MTNQTNIYQVYRVAFNEPPLTDDSRTEFFFTSLSAIYDTFTPEQIGCKVSRLYNIGVSDGTPYQSNGRKISWRSVLPTRFKNPMCVKFE